VQQVIRQINQKDINTNGVQNPNGTISGNGNVNGNNPNNGNANQG
tara:strand:- start:376 stop:510 length:135 start_codon:yes stop_codon:yes gene_type:complete